MTDPMTHMLEPFGRSWKHPFPLPKEFGYRWNSEQPVKLAMEIKGATELTIYQMGIALSSTRKKLELSRHKLT